MPIKKICYCEGNNKIQFTDGDKLVSQGLMFFAAGTETTSGAVSYTLYEFAMHPEIQEKARTEVSTIIAKKGFTYEAVNDMVYLEMCVLGKHAVLEM